MQTRKALDERKKNNEGLRTLMGAGQSENEVKMSEALEKVASEHGIESVTAVALAYVMSKAPNGLCCTCTLHCSFLVNTS